MKIREIERNDLKGVLEVDTDKISSEKLNVWLPESFNQKKYGPRCLIAEEEGKIIGYVCYAQSRINYRIYQIFSLFVGPDFRNKGIGSKLMERAIENIKSLRREKNDDYIILLTAIRPDYYEKRFNFKTLIKINVNGSCLMHLRV